MTDDVQTHETAFPEAIGREPSDAQMLASYARTHWPELIRGADSLEQIGRALVTRASCGPIHWSGIRILKELGILVDGGGRPS